MTLFLFRKYILVAAAFAGLVLTLCTGLLFFSCEQPGGVAPAAVNAGQPIIHDAHPAGGDWDVSGGEDTFILTVSASSPDGGNLSYQWYSNSSPLNTGGTPLGAQNDNPYFTLSKSNYASDGTRYFYVVVRNTINNNGDGGKKTAELASSTAELAIFGNVNININFETDFAKIGVDPDYPLSGTYLLQVPLTLENWTPIGAEAEPFTGVFDGNNKTITLNGFAEDALSNKSCIGIFGYVKGDSFLAKAEIRNLTIDSSVDAISIKEKPVIGLLAGYAEMAEIKNIELLGKFDFESNKTILLGGIAGYIGHGSLIANCSSSSFDMNISPGNGSPLLPGLQPYSYVGGFIGIFRDGAGIEDCHYKGNVTADSTVAGSQLFAGGIAGGSMYDTSTAYRGYIKNSSFNGNIIGNSTGSWTITGGIAGTIAGGGNGTLENTTRIERCFAAGTVSVAGKSSGFSYVGGIVGDNYYGALVSRSYFSGTVISGTGQDYTGGIAGYNSQTTGSNSRIEDCWSEGVVQGHYNAGGIVGQNQVETYIRRCYSLADVSVKADTRNLDSTWGGVGGIAGVNFSLQPNSITGCVALNNSLSVEELNTEETGTRQGDYIGRIIGQLGPLPDYPGTRSSNYALPGMTVRLAGADAAINPTGHDTIHGENLDTDKPARTFYESLDWDFTGVWKMDITDDYPLLAWQE